MIRIRFFGPGELFQKGFRAAQYVAFDARACIRQPCLHIKAGLTCCLHCDHTFPSRDEARKVRLLVFRVHAILFAGWTPILVAPGRLNFPLEHEQNLTRSVRQVRRIYQSNRLATLGLLPSYWREMKHLDEQTARAHDTRENFDSHGDSVVSSAK